MNWHVLIVYVMVVMYIDMMATGPPSPAACTTSLYNSPFQST